MRPTRNAKMVPRPHSADFLEYEARATIDRRNPTETVRVPRPKSSLDINRTPDNFYYSEASYAEKMRQSALYLQNTPGKIKPDEQYRSQKRMNCKLLLINFFVIFHKNHFLIIACI